jgi:TonB family protein
MAATRFYHSASLPWTAAPDEDRRFRIAMAAALGASVLLGVLVPLIQTPDRTSQFTEVPDRFARLIVEENAPTPPPPPAQQAEPEPPAPEAEKAEQPKAEEPPPQAKPEPKAATPRPEAARPSARERASRAGLLALSSQLADLRAGSGSVASDLERQPLRQPSATPRSSDTATERSIITSQVNSGSGGIDVSRLSRDTGGTQLAGRETTRVEAPIEGAYSSGGEGGGGGARSGSGRGGAGSRSLEEIQRVFDANRGALNTLYNRALRDNPALAGKVVLKLTILPNGDISELELVSSELKDAELEHRLLARVRLFKFSAKNVAVTTITYPIDFFPG